MNQFFQNVVTKVKDNKNLLIKVGSILTGALVGALIGSAFSIEDDYISVEDNDSMSNES